MVLPFSLHPVPPILADGGLHRSEEERASARVGTADLLDMLIADEPDTDFALALGTDTFMDLTAWKWRRSRDVLSLVGGRILVIHRISDNAVPGGVLAERIKLVNEEFDREKSGSVGAFMEGERHHVDKSSEEGGPVKVHQIETLSDISSSFIRSCSNEEILKAALAPRVFEFIKDKQLYRFA
mmetsp:Transcript_47336/g.143345  ORF Transcript_47336/g.143345 Transcript_47336/m.143345 type:complete len:183 (-) Transcript_47336:362-910(-)